MSGVQTVTSMPALVARARALAQPRGPDGGRPIVGITGGPGAGKTTLVERLLAALGESETAHAPWAAHLPMDGFHLADAQLDRLGLRDRKGAPETFDGEGYAAVLARLRAGGTATVYAPGFERTLEQPIAAAIAVEPSARLVLTEGNYLLLQTGPWPRVRELMTEVWYVEVPDALRVERLVARHVEFGKTPEQARAWVARSDEANARAVAATRALADVIVALPA